MNNNFIAKVIGQIPFSFVNNRPIGTEIYVHLYEDGSVLLYSPADRKAKLPIFDHTCKDINEAKLYATCIKPTDFDVEGAWSKMMSERYW